MLTRLVKGCGVPSLTFCRCMSGFVEKEQWLEGVFHVDEKKLNKLFSGAAYSPENIPENPLTIENGKEIPIEYQNISEFSQLTMLDKRLQKNVDRLNFVKMTPVQRIAIPALLSGFDVLACAETGSGKTHAFLLPVVQSILSKYPQQMMDYLIKTNNQCACPLGMILAPSMSLALQLRDECEKLLCETPACVASSMEWNPKKKRSKRGTYPGCHILVGTPAKVVELVQAKLLNLSFCKHVVVDEIDNYSAHKNIKVRELFNSTSVGLPHVDDRQTMLCSATVTLEDEVIGREFLNKDFLKIVPDSMKGTPVPSSISHNFIWTGSSTFNEKDELLIELVKKLDGDSRILIFCNRPRVAEHLEHALMKSGFTPSVYLDPSKYLSNQMALRSFHSKQSRIFISARDGAYGLDYTDVKYVINYDMPKNIKQYIHRIGRGGRMGNRTHAISLFGENDIQISDDLIILLEKCGAPIPSFLYHDFSIEET